MKVLQYIFKNKFTQFTFKVGNNNILLFLNSFNRM